MATSQTKHTTHVCVAHSREDVLVDPGEMQKPGFGWVKEMRPTNTLDVAKAYREIHEAQELAQHTAHRLEVAFR